MPVQGGANEQKDEEGANHSSVSRCIKWSAGHSICGTHFRGKRRSSVVRSITFVVFKRELGSESSFQVQLKSFWRMCPLNFSRLPVAKYGIIGFCSSAPLP